MISDAVAVYLKKANGGAESPDLSYARFWSSDWSGIKFRKANLTGTYFDQVQLDEADLSEVSRYTEAVFDRSAWWRAKAISPAFLAAIKKDPRHEYSVDKPYPTESPAIRPDGYARELKRLSAESRGPGLQVARPTGHR